MVTHGDQTRCALPEGDGLLLRIRSGHPTHRFCRSCLASDKIPFLRLCWRLRDWLICPLHREPLSKECPHCKQQVSFTTDRVNSDENCIAICKLCAGNLAEPDANSIRPTATYDERTLILQEATYSLAITGTFRVAGIEDPLSMYFYYWLRDNYRWLEIQAMMCQRPDPNLAKLILNMLEVYKEHCTGAFRITNQIPLR
jgi:hypothetical protein